MQTDSIDVSSAAYRPLLLDLQVYILQMRTLAEQLPESEAAHGIGEMSRHSLRALDFALYALDSLQTQLPLSTVSTTAVAHDVCQDLRSLASQYRADVQLDIDGHPAAAYTNARAIHGALYGLCTSMIMSLGADVADRRVILHIRQQAGNQQRLAVFAPSITIPRTAFHSLASLSSRGRSAVPSAFAHSSTGVVITHHLSTAIGSKLRSFRHQSVQGAGFYVPVSPQLSFLD